jgi:hypothetical protein
MIKRNPSPHTKSFPPLVLWRDDIEEIASVLKAHGSTVEIFAGEFAFEAVDELVERFGMIHPIFDLKMSGHPPYTSIDLNRFQSRLYVSGDSNGSGVFFEVSKILAARQRWFSVLYSQWFIWTIITLNIVLPLVLTSLRLSPAYWVVGLNVVVLSCISWAAFVNVRRHSVIHLERRIETKSFLQRKKDDIATIIISAIVGVTLGIIGTKLADKVWPASEGSKGQVSPSAEKPK